MTTPDDGRELEDAARDAAQSKLQSQQEFRSARERARSSLKIADLLRELREENGFSRLFDDAFGGGRA
jgi:acyl-CoA reductase-like NAD-dependent aldehyde dehydrogenase